MEVSLELLPRILETRFWRSTCWDCPSLCPMLPDCSMTNPWLIWRKGSLHVHSPHAKLRQTGRRETHSGQKKTSKELACSLPHLPCFAQSISTRQTVLEVACPKLAGSASRGHCLTSLTRKRALEPSFGALMSSNHVQCHVSQQARLAFFKVILEGVSRLFLKAKTSSKNNLNLKNKK